MRGGEDIHFSCSKSVAFPLGQPDENQGHDLVFCCQTWERPARSLVITNNFVQWFTNYSVSRTRTQPAGRYSYSFAT